MNTDQLHNYLNSDNSDHEKRSALIHYLKNQISSLPQLDDERTKIAYEIAGLMSTKYVLSLEDNDAIERIFSLAGELEIPNATNEQHWTVMVQLIQQL